MIEYATLKAIHVALALVSLAGLVARAVPAIGFDRRWTDSRVLHAVPHALDTLLLATGVWLAVVVGWQPWAHPWLAAKLGLLVGYIVMAWLALKPLYARPVRVGLLAGALVAFAWMATTAVTKSPWGPFSPGV